MNESACSNPNRIVLECENLKKSYVKNKRSVEVLKGIDLSLETGKMVVIRGKSGAGKSTLVNLLCGLDSVTSGRIRIENDDIVNLSNRKLADVRKNKVGIIFQNFNLIPSWTAFENIEAALLFKGLDKSERGVKIRRLLEELGLGKLGDNLPSELSAGQQQRVAIARAVINEPLLLFADEPTGDLDPETAMEIVQLLGKLAAGGITILVTTHGSFPNGVGDRIYEMVDGVLAEAG